jgi:hypothetical protein
MNSKVVVPLKPGSDADATHRPVGNAYSHIDPPTLYLEKLGQQWMQARGEARAGVAYILEHLPSGYALFQKPRASKPSTTDKWLYGHPDHKPFDSPNRFFPHFQYIMENDGSSIGCPCTVCNAKGGVLPRGASSRASSTRTSSSGASSTKTTPPIPSAPTHKSVQCVPSNLLQQTTSHGHVDEEGTPDVYRNLIDKLKRHGTLDEPIMESMSMDWRAEQPILQSLIESLEREAQWVPRVGDIVFFIAKLPKGLELLSHEKTGELMFWDPIADKFMGTPTWQAGLVSQTPVENVSIEDAVYPGEKDMNVSLSGVRVEPIPNANDANKSLSKQYSYVPVCQTRPFFLWIEYLHAIPEKHWHPTVRNALTVTATMSLMGRYHFRGKWPEAHIYCHGIYIGSEMLVVGDTVRLFPKAGQSVCTDILVIKSIRLKLANLDKASANDYDEGRPYNSECWIFGSAYSTESSRTSKEWFSAANAETPKSAAGYSKWYPLHPPDKEFAVPFSRILGRLFEHEAMRLWLPGKDEQHLDRGREGLLKARAFARANDDRINSSLDATWFWGDSRSEALDLHMVNGLETSRYDVERNPRDWRKKMKVKEGISGRANAAPGGSSHLKGFVAPGATSMKHHQSGLLRSTVGEKRNQIIDLSDEENDERIRRQTRVVDESQSTSRQKKAKVMVVIE